MQINESGRSMIEMLGVLAIIGVLTVGGIAGYSKAINSYRVNKTIDQVSQIASNVRTLFSGHKTYAALGSTTNAKLIGKSHLFPDELISGSGDTYTVQTNVFGGNITLVVGDKSASSDNKAFIITMTGIPQEACIRIATEDWGSGSSSGLVAMSVKGGTSAQSLAGIYVKAAGSSNVAVAGSSSHPIPMKVNEASAACSNTAKNVIAWKFY